MDIFYRTLRSEGHCFLTIAGEQRRTVTICVTSVNGEGLTLHQGTTGYYGIHCLHQHKATQPPAIVSF